MLLYVIGLRQIDGMWQMNCFMATYYMFILFRDESARLREQQDREYREAQEADRLEHIRREKERLRHEAEEEERKQQEELQRAVELSAQLSREDKTRKLRTYFEEHPEPAEGLEVAAI